MKTKSEQLFEQYCESNGVPCARIPVCDEPSPDYSITLGDVEVICEIKQVEESQAERGAFRQALETRTGAGYFPPNQLRPILKDLKQLKAVASSGKPTLLVVYDNTPFAMAFDHWNVVEALFGQIGYLVTFDGDGPAVSDERPFFGGKRSLTPQHNTSVSALAVLEMVDNSLVLRVYHNPYAAVTLESSLLESLPVDFRFRPGDTSIAIS